MRYLVMGAGGHAQEVAWSLAEHERGRGASYELLFFDDARPIRDRSRRASASIVGAVDAVPDHRRRREPRGWSSASVSRS